MNKQEKQVKSAKDILMNSDFLDRFQNSAKYISTEFQDYGLRLADRLNDRSHKALYIKLSKKVPRGLLDAAAQFALDYPNTNNKGRIFMWKLFNICKEKGIQIKLPKFKRNKKQSPQLSMFEK